LGRGDLVISLSMSLEEFSLSRTVERYEDRCIVADGILIEERMSRLFSLRKTSLVLGLWNVDCYNFGKHRWTRLYTMSESIAN
jgi:hypothetical protein